MHRSKVPYFFLGLSMVIALSALLVLFFKPGVEPAPEPGEQPTPAVPKAVEDVPIPALDKEPTAQDVAPTPPELLGLGLATATPDELVNRIADALQQGDLAALERLIGHQNLDEPTRAALGRLAGTMPRLREQGGIREVGELELNKRARWVLELEEPKEGLDRVVVDLLRDGDGWKVERVTLPEAEANPSVPRALPDSLGVADAFLQNVLRQDFQKAREFVDSALVSDAKIAGLCILFEEGDYRLRASRPLRVLFSRGDTAGYLANVDAADGTPAAQFGINLRQTSEGGPWLVTEVNLDALLADYASRVAGGDIYYSPFVRNPAGGDTIALYFEFDADGLSTRTARQLEIIAMVLKSDARRKLTISGHTDAIGSQSYNDALSARRAEVVRDFLVKAGVTATQVETLAKGASQPRRPNVTETGDDDPDGRRANRRTEIYLDF
jgi:outer membrane protein OmpA-like peptidoglycan-associated protein